MSTMARAYRIAREDEYPLWDAFIANHPEGSLYHLSAWGRIIKAAFGKRWYLIAAYENDTICGGLPLVHMKSWMFGNFLVSMPYFNYGGVVAEGREHYKGILKTAVVLSERLEASHIEFRHLNHCYDELSVREDKTSMWLHLPATVDELWKTFSSKLRSQIRKGEKNLLKVTVGGSELLDSFYNVFSRNMRSLGTPVYGRAFFKLILEQFPDTARIVIVHRSDGDPIASAFLLGYKDRMSYPSTTPRGVRAHCGPQNGSDLLPRPSLPQSGSPEYPRKGPEWRSPHNRPDEDNAYK